MSKSDRLFEIIQVLRSRSEPQTADALAAQLEVSSRTIYRDIASLQAMRVPIEGEAGVGYIMRPGYDLPPLMFTAEEVEAIAVGLAMLGRTGDKALVRAATKASGKIAAALPGNHTKPLEQWPVHASDWSDVPPSTVEPEQLRAAIREERKLRIVYEDEVGRRSERVLRPLAIIYFIESVLLAAWCELRDDFRHFRLDRIRRLDMLDDRFKGQGDALRKKWRDLERYPP